MKVSTFNLIITLAIFTLTKAYAETFVFSHGYGANSDQHLRYNGQIINDFSILGDSCIYFDYPDVYDQNKANLAQVIDINALKDTIDSVLSQNPDEEIILVGLSRGASTIINYACQYPKNIKAMVVEAPFDDLSNVINNITGRYKISWIPGMHSLANYIANKILPAYDPNGISPIKSIINLSKEIPVLFIHSLEDQLIPATCSRNLFNILRANNHINAHYITLDSGRHGGYIFNYDMEKYRNGVHAFYKKYGVAHNPEYAKLGEALILD